MFIRLALGILLAATIAQGAAAQTLPQPSGDIVLTVSGDIPVTNRDGSSVFDRDMLAAMPQTQFTTTTTWTDGPQVFTGVSLKDLLGALGVTGGALRAYAVNDYAVDIPVTDAVEGGPIVAYLWNGEPMSVRDKGPLWIVYPYDSRREYRQEAIYARSIWQLERMEVRP